MADLATRLGIQLTITDRPVPFVPPPDGGPVRDALDVAIQLLLDWSAKFPHGHPVRDRCEQSCETLMALQDNDVLDLDIGIPELCDRILFGGSHGR